ncbi:methyltransferase, FxLD system [Streptomyces goshikiensis]|uniref:methyltransferase, FxLD system n=1 Tax=Streptomyces goshikiensis TaxID=1942 RepID=UPI0036A37C39
MSSTHTAQYWHDHYEAGRDFRPLTDAESALLTERLALPEDARGARALDVACGTGEVSRALAAAGYRVDAVDWARSALDRAEAAGPDEIAYHQLDVTDADLCALTADGGYRVITMRRVLAHLPDRTRTVTELAALLEEDGVLCVITPHADRHPPELRDICLDDAEIGRLCDAWEHAERIEVAGSTVVLLRGPKSAAVAYAEKRKPTPAAMAGVAVVVTNSRGQVLLGWNNARSLWELPAGKVEPGEPFEATAVRELAEESGLAACAEDVLLLGTLCDATNGGVTRVTEIARITAFTGEPEVREADLSRWEWHTLSDLRHLPQPLFTASAQAVNLVWPGLLPDVPAAHHTPRPAGSVALTFGEPAAAVRLRERLVQDLTEAGWTDSPGLQRAFATVPRQAFLPEQPLHRTYANEAVATVFDEDTGRSMSSVSQPEMQAVMLREAGLREGDRVLEIGGGGYNACLTAELVGPAGSVVCVEIDPYVHARTVRFLEETRYADRVRAVLGDGTLGAPDALVPAGGFDAILVTVGANDIPQAWHRQLADGRHLVLPLRIGGFTRALSLRKEPGHLASTWVSVCGFVPIQGGGRWDETPDPIGASGYGIRWEDTTPAPLDGLDRALATAGVEVRTGVSVVADESFEHLQLWLATSVPGFCRLTGEREQPGRLRLPKHTDAMAMMSGGSMAVVVIERLDADEHNSTPTWEFRIQGFGPDSKTAADILADAVRTWDRELRDRAHPVLTIWPADIPGPVLPAGDVVDKALGRIAVTWPGRDRHTAPRVAQHAAGGNGDTAQ